MIAVNQIVTVISGPGRYRGRVRKIKGGLYQVVLFGGMLVEVTKEEIEE